jgi:hypothetical protein
MLEAAFVDPSTGETFQVTPAFYFGEPPGWPFPEFTGTNHQPVPDRDLHLPEARRPPVNATTDGEARRTKMQYPRGSPSSRALA